jgi:hypothetical protein
MRKLTTGCVRREALAFAALGRRALGRGADNHRAPRPIPPRHERNGKPSSGKPSSRVRMPIPVARPQSEHFDELAISAQPLTAAPACVEAQGSDAGRGRESPPVSVTGGGRNKKVACVVEVARYETACFRASRAYRVQAGRERERLAPREHAHTREKAVSKKSGGRLAPCRWSCARRHAGIAVPPVMHLCRRESQNESRHIGRTARAFRDARPRHNRCGNIHVPDHGAFSNRFISIRMDAVHIAPAFIASINLPLPAALLPNRDSLRAARGDGASAWFSCRVMRRFRFTGVPTRLGTCKDSTFCRFRDRCPTSARIPRWYGRPPGK